MQDETESANTPRVIGSIRLRRTPGLLWEAARATCSKAKADRRKRHSAKAKGLFSAMLTQPRPLVCFAPLKEVARTELNVRLGA